MNIIRMAVGLTALNVVLFLGAWAQAGPGTQTAQGLVRARAFELVDERSQIRARLNVESNGEVVFRLLDQKGTIRVKLGAGTDGSALLLANDATEPGVHLLATAAGSSVKLANKDGRQRVILP
jgi:hypothetical protein